MTKDFEHSDSGNWNVAESWSTLMIFKPFQEASKYLTMAKKGCSDIEEEFMFDDDTKIRTRISAIKWARDKIEEGIIQSMFAVNKDDLKIVTDLLQQLRSLEEFDDNNFSPINNIELKLINRDGYKITINEEAFNIIYKCLKRIYTEVMFPLNRSDLIFMYKERFDKEQFKENVMKRFTEGD